MTLRIPAKVLIHVWSYDFYDMTLSTGKQRRHMINKYWSQVIPSTTINTVNLKMLVRTSFFLEFSNLLLR